MTSLSKSNDRSSSILSWLSAVEPPCTGSVILQQSRKRARSAETLPPHKRRLTPSKRRAKSLEVDMSKGGYQHGLPSPKTLSQQGTEDSIIVDSVSSSHPDSLKLTKNAFAIRDTLAMHGMYISLDKLATYPPYKHFRDDLMNMLAGKRNSPGMDERDAERLVTWLKRHNTLPESEILHHIVTALVPLKGRTQKLQPFQDQSRGHESSIPTPTPANTDQQQIPEFGDVIEFSEDHLLYCTTSRLCKDLLPSWKKGQLKSLEKAMEKEIGISEPRPDYCFGLEWNMHPNIINTSIDEYTRVLIGVRSNLLYPFLIFEGKGARGSLADAENQAIRGGATLVYARRILNYKAGLPYSTGPDKQSFAFSMTLDCYTATVWVHWCEVQPREADIETEDNTSLAKEYYETYHMDSLVSCHFFNPKNVQDLMRTLNNILDWGCLQRKKEIDDVLKALRRKEAPKAPSPLPPAPEKRNQQTDEGDESGNKRPRNDK